VRVDYRKGMKKIVEYLYSLGHLRMAFVGHHSTLGPLNERRKTFLDSVAQCSPSAEARIVAGTDGLEGGREAARDLLGSGFHPTAIICVTISWLWECCGNCASKAFASRKKFGNGFR